MTGNRWRAALAIALLGVVLAASAGCSGVRSPARSTASVLAPAKLPAVTGSGVRALWQGAPWAYLTFDGGTLLGVGVGVGALAGAKLERVHAISAATGKPLWTVTMPKSLPEVLGLVPAGNVVVVEAGHPDENSVAMEPIATEYVALDVKTGRTRWTAPIGGTYQSPPTAVSGKYLLTGDTSDAVTGRIAATGAIAWRDPRPSACGPPFNASAPGVGLAADGSLAGASFYCGRRVFVWRLNPATGKALWIWRSPSLAPGSAQFLMLTAAASDGGLLLLNGDIAPPSAGQQFTGALPNPHRWPTVLGPVGEGAVLALAASDGRPRCGASSAASWRISR
jgi:outer membrane protein assembly factor BamB